MNFEKGKMREILFRGKRIDNGEWVEGQTIVVIHQDDNDLIFMPQRGEDVKADPMDGNDRALTSIYGNYYYQILPQTVGQFTGLTDKNGKKIFEGDIVEFPDHGNGGTKMGQVQYDDVETLYEIIYEENICIPLGESFHGFELEVIRNIHDNPELLEVMG